MIRAILLALLFLVPLTGTCSRKKTVHIRSFKKVIAAVNRAKSFQVIQPGEEAAWTMVSCPDRMARTTLNDVGMRSASVSIGNDVWQSHKGISGPWVKQNNPGPQTLCGKAGLVFPADLDLKTAVRGKLITNTQGSCEEWLVRTKQKGSTLNYIYCVGRNNLPVFRTFERDPLSYIAFSDWNKPLIIEPPKNGEPPCCPPMR